jgi:putative transposase
LPKLTKAPPKSREKKTGKEPQKNTKKTPQKKDEDAQRLWELWLENNPEIMAVAEKFIFANCYSPKFMAFFLNHYSFY